MKLEYELTKLTAYDGLEYPLTDGSMRFVVSTPGEMGLPPITWLTRQGYKQDGVSEVGYRLAPRAFNASIRLVNKCSRDEYWAIRSELLEIARPNRGGQLTFTIRLSNGELRSITARLNTPTFPEVSSDTSDEWGLSDVLQFECFNPVWFDAILTSDEITYNLARQLHFPMAFRGNTTANQFFFEGDGSLGTTPINYTGTWYSYPTFVITGPFDRLRIYHQNLNVEIGFSLPFASGETLTIDLENRTITDQNGVDRWGYLTPNSDIQGFKIEPDPIVPNGINTISYFIPGALIGVGQTTVTVTYRRRFIGI